MLKSFFSMLSIMFIASLVVGCAGSYTDVPGAERADPNGIYLVGIITDSSGYQDDLQSDLAKILHDNLQIELAKPKYKQSSLKTYQINVNITEFSTGNKVANILLAPSGRIYIKADVSYTNTNGQTVGVMPLDVAWPPGWSKSGNIESVMSAVAEYIGFQAKKR